jgi:hypothetical protein
LNDEHKLKEMNVLNWILQGLLAVVFLMALAIAMGVLQLLFPSFPLKYFVKQ